jgi:hypothetical protein
MKQMKINPQVRLSSEARVLITVNRLNPSIFRKGNVYYCLFGPDPKAGVFGSGPTLEAAIKDWDQHLGEFVLSHDVDDPVAEFVMRKLNSGI